MKILIIGSGAREHAIVVALSRSKHQPQLYCVGSSQNPGIADRCEAFIVGDVNDVSGISTIAQKWRIDLAMIGPENPLEVGLADQLWALGIPTIGPRKKLARIESSKTYARELMAKYQIPGLPLFRTFTDMTAIPDFLETLGEDRYVIKANGLMGGKGVKVAGEHLHSFAEALTFCEQILALNQSVLIEEKLIGQEFSAMCFYDGKHVVPMPLVQDHKRAFVNDQGPNTGGMGSYSAANHGLPFLTDADISAAQAINAAVLQALTADCGETYVGILYGSYIATANGVQVIEFNARFGDPESLNVLSILESDFVELCQAMTTGDLETTPVRFAQQATVCKYVVPEGYPDHPVKQVAIEIGKIQQPNNLYLGAVHAIDNQLLATGSRTAAYVGIADSITAAEQIAEEAVRHITGPVFHREDIGTAQLIEQRMRAMQALRSDTC